MISIEGADSSFLRMNDLADNLLPFARLVKGETSALDIGFRLRHLEVWGTETLTPPTLSRKLIGDKSLHCDKS